MNLAEFLRSEMETKHLSKSELARRIGVYPDYVRRWLNGDIPQPERCKQIGDALGLSPNTIMRMAGYPVEDGVPSADPKKAADVMEMGRILDEAPEGKRPEVLAIVRAVVQALGENRQRGSQDGDDPKPDIIHSSTAIAGRLLDSVTNSRKEHESLLQAAV